MRLNFRPFHRLQWQLSFSYMLVTVATLLAIEIGLFSVAALLLNSDAMPDLLMQGLRQQFAGRVAEYLETGDQQGLDAFLNPYVTPNVRVLAPGPNGWRINLSDSESDGEFLVVDRHYNIVWAADTATRHLAPGQPLDRQSFSGLDQILAAAFRNASEIRDLHVRAPGNLLVLAMPARTADGPVVGALIFIIRTPSITSPDFLRQLLPTLAVSLLLFTLLAGGVGTIFGFFTARRFTRRLNKVMNAAGAWSRGDFSTFIVDRDDDELGALARRLNVMAEQLQNLLHTRQELAMLEERNRIARELHDSVKQQVFATAMQLGAARALLPAEESPAAERLAEAERLTRLAQSELTNLIRELRPVALEGKGLSRALHEMAVDWSRQTGISMQFHLINEPVLPLLKDQALYRVTQEALSNIARHSGARGVEISLGKVDGQVRLTISDNGSGFDPNSTGQGLGLRSMRERIEAVGGSLSIQSAPSQGTQLTFTIALA